MMTEAALLNLSQVAATINVPLKTLQNRIINGSIVLGGSAPPLRTLQIGRRRLVARAELNNWLRALGALTEPSVANPAPVVEPAPVRRPGRPRRKSAGAAA